MDARALVVAASLGFVLPLASAQGQASYRNRVLGVFDSQSGLPIEGVEIGDLLAKVTALTTKTGTVTLAFLPEGETLIRIRKVGYEPTTMVVAISPDDTLPITALLKPSVPVLPTVVTKDSAHHYFSPGLRAFEERRLSGNGGRFITEEELRKHDDWTMTNMVRRLPGLTVKCIDSGIRRGECIASSLRTPSKLAIIGGGCLTEIYVNGIVFTDNDLQKLP